MQRELLVYHSLSQYLQISIKSFCLLLLCMCTVARGMQYTYRLQWPSLSAAEQTQLNNVKAVFYSYSSSEVSQGLNFTLWEISSDGKNFMSAIVMDVLVVQMYETGFKFFATSDSLGKDLWEHSVSLGSWNTNAVSLILWILPWGDTVKWQAPCQATVRM